MSELEFQKLTPTQDVDLSGYEEAFQYIFSEDDIRNIAVSGAYSSGKSSVIESFKKNNPKKKFMHLSLAHFHAPELLDKDETSDSDSNNKKTENVIEGKILNQLIQQIPADKIPQTNFRIKRNMDWKKPALISGMICVFIALLLHCLKFKTWVSIVDDLNDGWYKQILSLTTIPWTRVVSSALAFCLLGITIFEFIKLQHSKNILRKISVQGNEIEIFSDSNESYFDKYLNEVLYLFENTGVDGIVFEDIDRFENQTIFERLREINTLTNIRLNNKKGNKVKKPLRFFYLLRDDIFTNKDRTKFFDYIIPVVPVLDSSNSYNKIKEYLEKAKIYDQFDDHFLRGISLYIDDLRIVKNIFNEFLIYNKKLNNIELDVNKLFAIIVYKNIFPKDFADLQLNRGFVYTLFESKGKMIEERISSIKEEISSLENRIDFYENEHLESQTELDIIRNSNEQEARRHGTYSPKWKDYENWLQNIFPKRKQALEDRKDIKISELQDQIEFKREEIQNISNLSFASFLNRDNINSVFHVDFTNEIDQTDQFLSIKGNPYFALLKYLISRGYIDESYPDYMTFFYPNSLSLSDKVFLRSVTDRTSKPENYPIESPAMVLENLSSYDFTQPETLNYTLSEYILTEQKNDLIRNMILQLANGKRFDYITGYMRSGKKTVPMVISISKYWPSMFSEALESQTIPDDILKLISYQMLNNLDFDTLEKNNIDGCLQNYISEKSDYLNVEDVDIEKMGSALSELQVSFTIINPDSLNNDLFDHVYQHNLYEITESNILLMLREKCGENGKSTLLPAFLTFLHEHREYPLCIYLLNNKNQTLSVYLEMYKGDIRDTSETIVNLLNDDDTDQMHKESYVRQLSTFISDIEHVKDPNNQKMAIVHQKVAYSADNILYYFNHYGLSNELIDFINSNPLSLDYSQSEFDDADVEKFKNACICTEAIKNDKYQQIMENTRTCIQDFSVENLSGEKLAILIDLGLIEMNVSNLRFIRDSYPDSVIMFIRHDIEKYIPITVGENFNIDEATNILEWEEVSDQQKTELLEHTNIPIAVKNKPYNDNLLIYIFNNNLHRDDIPWILENYSSFSENVKETILQIICDNLEFITSSNSERIDDELINSLFKSEEINFSDKIRILGATAHTLNITKLCEVLNYLDADKIADNLQGGKKKVKVTDENTQILHALKDAGVITEFTPSVDGQYYKSIKHCNQVD